MNRLSTDKEILEWYENEVKYIFRLGIGHRGQICPDPKTNRERLLTIHHNLVKDYKTLKNGYPKLSRCGYPICDEDKITDFLFKYLLKVEKKIYPFKTCISETWGFQFYYGRRSVLTPRLSVKKEERQPFENDNYNSRLDWYNKTDIAFNSMCFAFHLEW